MSNQAPAPRRWLKPLPRKSLNDSLAVQHPGPQKHNLNSTGSSCAAPNLWDLPPILGALLNVALYFTLRTQLPARIPVNWGSGGELDRWVSPARALADGLLLALGIWATLLVISLVLARIQEPAGAMSVRFLDPMRGLIPLGVLLLMGARLSRPLLGQAAFGLGLCAMLITPLAALVIGFLRLPEEALNPPPDPVSTGPGSLWKWGLFYVNPEDPRLLVPKLHGGGWALNLAHGRGRWYLVLFLALPLGLAVLFTLLNV